MQPFQPTVQRTGPSPAISRACPTTILGNDKLVANRVGRLGKPANPSIRLGQV